MKEVQSTKVMQPTVHAGFEEQLSLNNDQIKLADERMRKVFGISKKCFVDKKIALNPTFNDLRIILGYSHKSKRLTNSIIYIVECFAKAKKIWKPRYNLIFFNVFNHGEILSIENIAYWFYLNQDYKKLSSKEFQICLSIQYYARIINSNIKELISFNIDQSRLSIVVYYGLLENMSRLINIFFNDLNIDFQHELLLKEYRKFRNSIAHASMLYENGKLIYVDFKLSNGLIQLKSIKKLGTHVDEILNEIRILFVLISQIIELYQLTNQICR